MATATVTQSDPKEAPKEQHTSQVVERFCRPYEEGETLRLEFVHCKPGKAVDSSYHHPSIFQHYPTPKPEDHPYRYPTRQEQQRLWKTHSIEYDYWQKTQQEASGFFAARDELDSKTYNFEAHNTTLRLLIKFAGQLNSNKSEDEHKGVSYQWSEFAIFTKWQKNGKLAVLVQCDDREAIMNAIKPIQTDEGLRFQCQRDPYAIHAFVLKQLVKEFDISVWSWQKYVRQFEKSRALGINKPTKGNPSETTAEKTSPLEDKDPKKSPEPDYECMHEVARHTIHCTEMQATTINVIDRIIEEHSEFVKDHELEAGDSKWLARNVSKSLREHKSFVEGFHLRSGALEDRLHNEVNLAFTVVSQHARNISVRIAEAAQSDSASTKTIQFLGLIFLPPTFICSLFSTSFFTLQPAIDLDGTQGPPNGFGPDKIPTYWMMSERFWIFWAFALPLTALTVLIWSVWQNYSRLRHPTLSNDVPILLKMKGMLHPRTDKRHANIRAANEIEDNGGRGRQGDSRQKQMLERDLEKNNNIQKPQRLHLRLVAWLQRNRMS
ncbi:Hypothetical protein D9617_18g034870 [Elsinoe fawcettii]|nr:Hypothetical protein D9617_18g034870 [Elsinoe fawcettii]